MKTTKWLLAGASIILLAAQTNAQVYATSMMDLNNSSYRISNSGVLFNNAASQLHGYEIPKNDGTFIIYAAAMWFAGTNQNDQTVVAAMKYGETGNDYRPGPYSTTTDYNSPAYQTAYGDAIWSVEQSEIETHLQNFNLPGYVVPPSILNWPGNGDPSLGVAEQLAPYVDFNQNQVYDPINGDYPLVKGCRTLYMILNDDRLHTESGGQPIGLEMHYMFYQYEDPNSDAINDATFVDVRIVNRGTQTISDFYAGWFMDGDVGNYSDDYAGCDTTRNLGFMYNADNMDENFSGLNGYGANPPAFGLLALNRPYSSFSVMANGAGFPYTDPTLDEQYYQFLQGNWADGTPMLDIQGQPTKFMYHEDPNQPGSFSDNGLDNPPGDRRMVLAHDLGVFQPGQSYDFSYAIIYGRGSSNLQSVTYLQAVAYTVQEFYDHDPGYCATPYLEVSELQQQQAAIYPNPSTGAFRIVLPGDDQGTVCLRSVNGDVVRAHTFQGQLIDVDASDLSAGIYFVDIQGVTNYQTSKIVLSHP